MILRELTIKDEDRFLKYVKDWGQEKIVPSNNDFTRYKNFEEMITILSLDKTENDEVRVPAVTLFLFYDDEILGSVNIRMELNEHLEKIGGHIGYGVNPSNRGNGYAQYMVREALEYLNTMNVFDVLITCDVDNAGSLKVIEIYEGIESDDYVHSGGITKRFWVNNRKAKDNF